MLTWNLTSQVVTDLDVEKTLNCGQVFHWQKVTQGWVGAIDQKAIFLKAQLKTPNKTELFYPREKAMIVERYLALDHPLSKIRSTFPTDPTMCAAIEACAGIRIIRQPLWECLATFITSSMKQVAHIRQISLYLRAHFGSYLGEFEGAQIYSYPSIHKIAQQTEATLRAAGLGWRAKNLLQAAQQLDQGKVNLESIHGLEDDEAREKLCQLSGVGPKVANCVLLFAYERLSAVPIDVWIKRILLQNYFHGQPQPTERQLKAFAREYFGAYSGYAQQYLFHYARTLKSKR